jgi:hypothetical protein
MVPDGVFWAPDRKVGGSIPSRRTTDFQFGFTAAGPSLLSAHRVVTTTFDNHPRLIIEFVQVSEHLLHPPRRRLGQLRADRHRAVAPRLLGCVGDTCLRRPFCTRLGCVDDMSFFTQPRIFSCMRRPATPK